MPYRWELLLWLWLAYLFNQADRQVFGVVLPQLRAELGLTDVQAGLVATVFTAALAVTVPLAGYAGDVLSRERIVATSLFGWSAATLLAGFSSGLAFLIVVRSVATAVGEAFYAPSAFALVGQHHVETRGLAMAVHQTALYVGVVASGFAAGWLADRFGWRSAFWLFGACGILIAALLAWRLRPSGAQAGRTAIRVAAAAAALLRIPTVPLLALGLAGLVSVNVAYLTWMPTYLHERYGLTLAQAGFASMFYHHAAAFCGVLSGGRISDRLVPRQPRARVLLQAGALLAATPFLWSLGSGAGLGATCALSAGFGFFRGLYDSNIYAALYQVVAPRMHASAAGLVTAFAFVAGSAAPVTLGAIKQQAGLGAGLSALAFVYLGASACLWLAAAWPFRADFRNAQQHSVQSGEIHVSSER